MDLDKLYFDEGKAALGKNAGGLLARLKKAKGLEEAYAILQHAKGRSDGREYIGGVLRAAGKPHIADVLAEARAGL